MDRHSVCGGYGRRLRVCRLCQKSQRRWECHPPQDPCELPRSPLPALLNNRNWTSSLELYEARLENSNRTRILHEEWCPQERRPMRTKPLSASCRKVSGTAGAIASTLDNLDRFSLA